MSHAVCKQRRTNSQPFTISETETDIAEGAVLARTKRYAFYWLLGEEPVLLAVRDYDGRDVTGEVEPPDGMCERLAQHG